MKNKYTFRKKKQKRSPERKRALKIYFAIIAYLIAVDVICVTVIQYIDMDLAAPLFGVSSVLVFETIEEMWNSRDKY